MKIEKAPYGAFFIGHAEQAYYLSGLSRQGGFDSKPYSGR